MAAVAVAALALLSCIAGAEELPGEAGDRLAAGGLSLEHVELRSGRRLSGLIESADEHWVYLAELQRPAGRPSFLVVRPIDRQSIASIDRLEGAARERLVRIVDELRNRARIEAARLNAVRLKPGSRAGIDVQRYRGGWFVLESTADQATTRRLVVRVEQVFAAYRQVLPPRVEPRRPLRILVFDAMDGYREYLRRHDLKLQAPAVYLQAENLIVAGSPLGRYLAEMRRVEAEHEELRDQIDRLEDEMRVRLRRLGTRLLQQRRPRSEVSQLILREKRRVETALEEKRSELEKSERKNDGAFVEVTAQMFQRLGHEAFHAYLENYVFPHDEYHVPIWLNEGLATMFETGLLETGTLRVDAPHPRFLPLLQEALRRGNTMSLRRVLRAGPGDFVDKEPGVTAQSYASAWGLAYYLSFERDLLGRSSLEHYVDGAAGLEPVARFERLVGQPLDEFARQWRSSMLALGP